MWGSMAGRVYCQLALLNFLALLGWNPKTTQELFSLEELIQHFSIEGLNAAPAVFDLKKLEWMNQQHLKKLSDRELWGHLEKIFKAENFKFPESAEWQVRAVKALRGSFSDMDSIRELFHSLSLNHFEILEGHPSGIKVAHHPGCAGALGKSTCLPSKTGIQ